jgi:hypothetical protein
MTQDFSFIFDARIRNILERDYTELQQLKTRISTKSVIVLSGGIIESLLFDALVASGKWTFEEACNNFLKDMIGPAKGKGIIQENRLTDATRRYRNLIHPGREIKENMVFEEADAVSAKSALDIVIREVRNWSISEQRQRRLRKFLGQLNQEQTDFLRLFADPKPTGATQFEHQFLSHAVYASIPSLIENGVLERETPADLGKHKERIRLVSDTVALVEELIIKGTIQRDSITLDYKNIAASGAGGSGAPPNNSLHRSAG